jgi:predicted nucleic acid-binding Zn ribbon protein
VTSPAPRRKAEPIANVLKSVFTQLESKHTLSKEAVDRSWREAVGERGFNHSRPSHIRKGVMTVSVDSSTWMQELSMRKRELLKGLKRELGKDRISEIRFKIGELQ